LARCPGFFGIGGGFLIVPGLIGATAMPLINAIGSSLVSVTAFGLTTAASYAWSGLVDWRLAFIFVLGGALGGLLGIRLATYLLRPQDRADSHFFGHRDHGRMLCRRKVTNSFLIATAATMAGASPMLMIFRVRNGERR
jgi:hypothetical protein